MKKIIRLTENDLHRIVKESAEKIIREMYYPPYRDGDISDNDFLNDSANENEYYRRLESLKSMQKADGDEAMKYHPQNLKSSLHGEDFASSYAKDKWLEDPDNIKFATDMNRYKTGLN